MALTQRLCMLPVIKVPCNTRTFVTTSTQMGKRNFRSLFLGNKRGTKIYKERRYKDPDFCPDIPIYTDVKPIGYRYGNTYKVVPEMIPEFIVPDLTDCPLKPYVSYRVNDVSQGEFTAKDLFSYVYEDKIKNDFKEGKLDVSGQPLEPSEEEKLSAEVACLRARRTGSDIFSERIPRHWECLEMEKPE